MTAQDPPVALGPELDFLRELWALDHALQKRSKRMEATLGVTGPQRLALRLVSRFPGLPAGRLARLLHLHPSTVTGVVKRLVERGLLTRNSDAPDRRRSLLRVTPAGMQLLARSQPTIESAVRRALATMSPRQVDTALKALSKIAVSLEAVEPDEPKT
jgi:MarR family transcriptional regulator, organic hydroperoxide resistance regulator